MCLNTKCCCVLITVHQYSAQTAFYVQTPDDCLSAVPTFCTLVACLGSGALVLMLQCRLVYSALGGVSHQTLLLIGLVRSSCTMEALLLDVLGSRKDDDLARLQQQGGRSSLMNSQV